MADLKQAYYNLMGGVKKKLSDAVGDNTGWFRQGQFTPVQQIKDIRTQASNSPVTTFGPMILPNLKSPQVTNLLASQKRYELPQLTQAPVVPKIAYNYLAKPVLESVVNIPRNISTGTARIAQQIQSGKPTATGIIGGVLPLAEGVFDLSTMGLTSVGKNIAKESIKDVTKSTVGKTIAKGALTGSFLGGLGGSSREIDAQYGQQARPVDVIKSGAIGSLIGGMLGGTISTGSVAWEKGLENITRKIIGLKPNIKPTEAKVEAQRYLRNKLGEFAGKNPDYKTPSDIKFYGDLNESLGLNRYDRTQMGMSIRKIGDEERKLVSKTIQQTVQPKIVVPRVTSEVSKAKLRGFARTITEETGIPKEIKSFVKTQVYEPLTNKETLKNVSKIVKRGDSFAIAFAKNNSDTNGNATAVVILDKLIKANRFDEANDLIETISPRFTKQGQQVQILSLFGRLTPSGAIRYAQKLIDKANKENPSLKLKLTPENSKLITDRAKVLGGMVDGSREKIVATAQLMQEIANIKPTSLGQKIATAQTISQLLNFKTPIRNILGNIIFSGIENVKDVVATGADAVTSLFTGQNTKGLPSLSAQFGGLVKGAKEGLEDVRLGIDTSGGVASQFDLPNRTFTKGIMDKLEKTLNVTLRVPDRASYTAAFEGSLRDQLSVSGVTKPTEKMLEVAHADALYRTFQDNSRLAQVFGGIKKTLNKVGTPDGKFGLGDLILKYPKTPANILSRGLDYSPVGFVKGIYEAVRPIISGQPFNQRQFVENLSRGLVGTGLITSGYVLAENGILTGKSPKDYDISSTQQSTGGGQFKVNVSALKRFFLSGGKKQSSQEGDVLVSYDWAQPASLSFSIGADMALNGDVKSSISSSLDASTETLTNQPLVKGLTSVAKDVQDYGVGTALTKTALGTPASFTPSILNQFANIFDETRRSTYSPNKIQEAKNKVISRIPLLRNELQPSLNVFGKEQPNYEGGGLSRVVDILFNPAFVSTIKNNPSATEVLNIYQRSGETQQAPRVAPKTVKINGVDIKVTPEKYTEYQKYIGTRTQSMFDQLIVDPVFNKASDEEKAQLMANMLSNINSAAKIEVFGNQPKRVETSVKNIIKNSSQIDSNYVTFTKDGNLKYAGGTVDRPKLTGNTALDKKLISDYNGSITTKINDIVELYKNGGISAVEAEKQIAKLSESKISTAKAKKPKTVRVKSLKLPKLPKLKISKITTKKTKRVKPLSKVRVAKLKTVKVKPLTLRVQIRKNNG